MAALETPYLRQLGKPEALEVEQSAPPPDWPTPLPIDHDLVPVEPFRMNERLAAQQGGFLFPTSGGHRFADNLAALLDEPAGTALLGGSTEDFDPGDATLAPVEESTILKVILPREIHTDAIINLEDMNVSSASLFGGLDGFARSLTRSLRIFDRIPKWQS